MPIGVMTAPFLGVYGPRPYEAQPAQKQTQGSPAMTQVTDQMVIAAEEGWSRADNSECSPRECWHAALEAALAVREPTQHNDVLAALRGVTPNNKLASDAADLIERQAEEIADNEAFVSILQKEVQRLTAERAELIEALRPFSEWSLELKGMDDDNLLLATYDKAREGNRFGTVGDCRRARALLERLGAVIRD